MTTPAAKKPERNPDDRLGRVEHDVADLKTATMRLTTVVETIDDRQRKFGEELGSVKAVLLKHGEQLVSQGEQLSRQGEQLSRQGEQLSRQGEQLSRQGEQLASQGEQLARQGEELAGLKAAVLKQGEEMSGLKTAILKLVSHVEKLDERQRKQGEDIARIDGHIRLLPTLWQIATLVFAIFGASFVLLRLNLPHGMP